MIECIVITLVALASIGLGCGIGFKFFWHPQREAMKETIKHFKTRAYKHEAKARFVKMRVDSESVEFVTLDGGTHWYRLIRQDVDNVTVEDADVDEALMLNDYSVA